MDIAAQTFAGVKTFINRIESSVSTGNVAMQLTAGARVHFASGDANAWLGRTSANIIGTPGTLLSSNTAAGFFTSGAGGYYGSSGAVKLMSEQADGASAVAMVTDTIVNWANAAALLASYRNNGVEKASISKDGSIAGNAFYARNATYGFQLGTAGNAFVSMDYTDNTWHHHFGTLSIEATMTAFNAGITMNSTVASTGNAVKLLDGARVNFSTADASAYLYRSAANTIRTPGSFTVDTALAVGANASITGSSGVFSGVRYDLAGLASGAVGFQAAAADLTTAKAFRFNNTVTLGTGNAMLAEFQNNGTKLFGITYYGRAEVEDIKYISGGWRLYGGGNFNIETPGGAAAFTLSVSTFQGTFAYGCNSDAFGTYTASSMYLRGSIADGAGAVAAITDNSNTLADASAKLLSVRNNTVERFYVGKNGNVVIGAGLNGATIAGGTSSILTLNNNIGAQLEQSGTRLLLDSTGADLRGNVADGASAIGVVLGSLPTYSNATSKLLSLKNNATEKAYVRYDGGIYSGPASLDGSSGVVVPTHNGALRNGFFKTTIPYTAFSDPGDTITLVLADIPAKTRITSVVADVTTAFDIPAPATDMLMAVGWVGNEDDLIDVFTAVAPITRGLADGDLGTALTRATAVQGGAIPSWTATKQLSVTLFAETGGPLEDLTQGSVTVYVTYETLGT